MVFCPLFQRSEPPTYTPRPATPPKLPIMDLSSLDGPPLIASRVLITPSDPMTSRIHEEPPTPQGAADAYHFARSKPLPARPVSADPPAGGRRSPSEDLLPGDLPARDNRDNRSQSPHHSPDLEAEPVPRRTRSCSPLVWSEEESMWVVEGPVPVDFASSRPRHSRPPQPPTASHTPERARDIFTDEFESVECPPSYDSHAFTPSHVMRMREGVASRWGAVAHRVQHSRPG
ncbi:hypothetical protein N7492_001143 [Penicillium capsulatum]|uniref:Uncharacterized protein n=1 Tax=Penicillium capsulatum TaxID=69766 RepID=A0A9W9IT39_9EURO|nr:hypothetical protein N7492_001143 [Penicillium capsulatum]